MLRSAEAKLLFNRFVQLRLDVFSFFCDAFTSGEVPYWLQAPSGLVLFFAGEGEAESAMLGQPCRRVLGGLGLGFARRRTLPRQTEFRAYVSLVVFCLDSV